MPIVLNGSSLTIGEFSQRMLNDQQVLEFQKHLIYNHPAGDRPGA